MNCSLPNAISTYYFPAEVTCQSLVSSQAEHNFSTISTVYALPLFSALSLFFDPTSLQITPLTKCLINRLSDQCESAFAEAKKISETLNGKTYFYKDCPEGASSAANPEDTTCKNRSSKEKIDKTKNTRQAKFQSSKECERSGQTEIAWPIIGDKNNEIQISFCSKTGAFGSIKTKISEILEKNRPKTD